MSKMTSLLKGFFKKIRAKWHNDLYTKIDDSVTLNRSPLLSKEIVYATPPEFSNESIALLDTDSFRNFRDQHKFSIISFSGCAQDKIVEAILHMCNIAKPSYLDIGCNLPIEISNTALFYRKGSRGVVVDASEAHRHRWSQLRPNDVFVHAAISPADSGNTVTFYMIDEYSGRNSCDLETINKFIKEASAEGSVFNITKTIVVDALTINEIVDTYCCSKFPDYLSIDIEGLDLQVLESIDFSNSSPVVISIEANSAKAISVLKEKGFQPIICVGDIIAVHNDYVERVAPWIN